MTSKFIMGFIAGSVCTGMMMTTFGSISAANINTIASQKTTKTSNVSDVYAWAMADTNYASEKTTFSSSSPMSMYRDQWTAKYYSPPFPPGDGKTTVIVCSNLIPSHPSIWMINQTIQSVARYVVNLESDYQLIITVDGLRPTSAATQSDDDALRLDQYVQALYHTFPHVTIVGGYTTNNTSIGLSRNVKSALNATRTEFIYLLQHDMPFRKTIQHDGLAGMARSVADQYPFNVRFNKKANLVFGEKKRGACFNAKTQLNYHNATGVHFLKTSGWSDK